ncbi:hypothetical protein ABZ891_06260 [Streptomyces sp. NPDC047023]|uniref:YaaC family protein n=1 Tax=Streptomyces sp. NPDC047023 TaxID=3155139 RepID=UPI0033E15EEB
MFVASLEQAQQFTEAAAAAGPATRPVQIFYALSQFGRAISAASTLNGGADWRLKAHGIRTEKLDAGNGLASVGVIPTAKGSLPGVAQALGVASFDAGVELTLGVLWPLIPETRAVPLPGGGTIGALSASVTNILSEGMENWARLQLLPIASGVSAQAQTNPAALDAFLAHYPTLQGRRSADFMQTPAVAWGVGQELQIFVPAVGARPMTEQALTTSYRGQSDRFVFPAVGSMAGPVHPLLAWWAVLFGLSILARYEPEHWAAIIDIDKSMEANAVENLLEHAVAVVPHLALLAIQEASGP